MILHCFEQIMQFRYFVPAAAYSKDKYRLLFRESRVPAFFPVSLPGVGPTQESPSVAISGRLSRIRRGLSCCCGLVLRDCNKGISSRCALRAPRLAAQCTKNPHVPEDGTRGFEDLQEDRTSVFFCRGASAAARHTRKAYGWITTLIEFSFLCSKISTAFSYSSSGKVCVISFSPWIAPVEKKFSTSPGDVRVCPWSRQCGSR